jgi:peptidyl-prolyl cis-trans isomerase B (cyclophilin B)
MFKSKLILIAILPVVLLSILSSCGGQQVAKNTSSESTSSSGSSPKTYTSTPPMNLFMNKNYSAVLETNKGTMVLELFNRDAPKTVNNFVFLAREGFYDNTTFHRVIAGFMAQGGDPTGTGSGGPGYTIPDEITSHKHLTGTLSMARRSEPNTGGSQFFICFAPQPHLDGGYSVFGQLKEGLDVLNTIVQGDKLIRVTIREE